MLDGGSTIGRVRMRAHVARDVIVRDDVEGTDYGLGRDLNAISDNLGNAKIDERKRDDLDDCDFNEDTKLVLINAIYFNAKWLNTFNTLNTKNKVFHVTKEQTKLVPTMFNKSQYNYGNIPTLQAKFIEIPYMNTDIVMIIILPNEIDGLQNVQSNFSWEALANASRFYNDIELYLPKFKIEFSIDLKSSLYKLGLKRIFMSDANFNSISNEPLVVDKVLHKAVIEVSEEGTEAAAATGNVEVIENRVTVCRDAVKGACMRPQCKYYHIPVALPPAPLMAITSPATP
ncbi:Serpin B4 [Eufriesea mexicana]|uniref:Serpin B4 n=1 Tax=Eufriesea mexicana TaxID=516756 RepID=A0A310SWB8_9HYME|nr:Serpin B4 [Eufriesea mexicana]